MSTRAQRERRRCQLFAKYALAASIKDGLEMQGFAVGDSLPPQPALDAAGRAEVRSALAAQGVLPRSG
jgi:4-hydroxy-tetrahydrodipicolinate synthase